MDFYLTKLLSGRDLFIAYLWKIGKKRHPGCPYGDAALDDAEHTFFSCKGHDRDWVEQF